MVFGFNHNFRYKGGVYHVQTEDSGEKNPQVVTLLYHGGTILASTKTSYADQLGVDQLEKQVEELMKQQHRDMLRRLKEGEFDGRIENLKFAAATELPVAPVSGVAADPSPAAPSPAAPVSVPPAASSPPSPAVSPPAPAQPVPVPATAPVVTASPAVKPPAPKPVAEPSLDDIILSYLMGEDS
ncbi:hypothetical protein [Trichloromonas acetexigens]|uniref:Uncharacterized protein n=1 Tax=Trichloromonas acetexigens TaxID=38815 RepID=A0A550JGW3_9BACT|nr:hypothetical protein [Desulfuromonas acetexigens]TRO82428.1 hypothetical protein FL622_07575 [Desulfuromonas acetexigens]